ncbi:MAG: type II toxin-antitoxin system RelE/ParE family toxin [Oceanicaulis sp.]|uniref:type II toxin-antitoxin system RelE/ParE family toxin n=1 Tax=Glycocaulis sp. TaxID=1969725 RepID=UPI0025C1276D|nr:type II toxin-antitoxin system RelE/ParE family toxin [Glycocaulis sp.]MCC5982373.1 type II toxin-antitoxin system RelE/ParE family toxin [Oceanicaulis sp.]MCH8521771.1 type II toxin-antitoxin system RelE/ParE family toxin [Glycocaulis sp.]
MARWRLSPEAGEDLLEIGRYTTQEWGEAQSERYLDRLNDTFHRLVLMPGLGRARDDIRPGVFSYPAGRHMVWYRPVETGIEILRVLHTRQRSEDALP